MSDLKPMARKSPALRVIFAFFVAFVLLEITEGITHQIILSIIVFINAWWIFALILLMPRNDNIAGQGHFKNHLIITAITEKIYHNGDTGRGWLTERIETYPRIVDLKKYLEQKGANRIIAIMGASRSGKSQLVYWIIQHIEGKKIIFQLKPTDDYVRLGYPVLYVRNAVPNCFKSAKSFTRAFITTFSISAGMHGITASTMETEVRKLAEGVNSWLEFKKKLERRIDEEKDSITKSALIFINNSIPLIYSDKMLDYDLPDECVIDFEGSDSKEIDVQFYTFYTEYLLNQMSNEIWNKRQNTIFVIDEAHLLVKSGKSVIPELSALIGAKGGMILASQRIADLQGQALDNCKTQFAFGMSGKENLDEISRKGDLMQTTLAEMLNTYEFVDIGQLRPDQRIYVFKLNSPSPTFYPIKEITIGEEASKEEHKTSFPISYETDIKEIIENPKNMQEIAKAFVEKYGKDINFWKMNLKSYLKKLVLNNEINGIKTDYVKFIDGRAYEILNSIIYYAKDSYTYHDWLEQKTVEVLEKKGFTANIQEHGVSVADIICEEQKLAFEIEVGTKFGSKMKETRDRFDEYINNGYQLFVVVPNRDVKARYGEYHPITLLELWKEGIKVEREKI